MENIKFGVGKCVAVGIGYYFGNFALYGSIGLICSSVLFLTLLFLNDSLGILLAIPIALLTNSVTTAITIHAVHTHLRGESITRQECFRGSGARISRAILTQLRVFVQLFLIALPLGIVSGLLSLASPAASLLADIPNNIIITVFSISYSLAAVIAVAEGLSATESIKRSKFLVEGYGWSFFGIFLLMNVLMIGLGAAALGIVSAISGDIDTALGGSLLWPALAFAWSVYTSIVAITFTYAYFSRRVEKEGRDLRDIVAEFA